MNAAISRHGRLGAHLRVVDEAVWAAVNEEVVKQTRDEPAAARGDDGPPDPVVMTKREH
jgi:hypothetical protein